MKDEKKHLNTADDVRIVTKNDFITAKGLSELTLKARKMLYLAMAQCRMGDVKFDTYEVTPTELAEEWGITAHDVQKRARAIARELMKQNIEIEQKNGWEIKHLFEKAKYEEDGVFSLKLNTEMADLLLGISPKQGNFSKPPLKDFMRMKSPYSMAVWHLMQREMRSMKPGTSQTVVFELSLEELRRVTGTENKLKQVGEFKKRVLDKALREIRENCLAIIEYTNIKRGKFITGFEFTARALMHIDAEEMPLRTRQKARRAELIAKKAAGGLSPEEFDELQTLDLKLGQMSLEDFGIE